ncbi:glycosyltransferase [Carnobacterium divergens]|uniref:glycosyltransferase n=1 Tax=Carnobacterium divergens TaxID=2748 RepID=UPI0039B106E0
MDKYSVVIVLFNPDSEFVQKNVNTLINNKQIDRVLLIDNSKSNLGDFNDILECKVDYLKLDKNFGIAEAQNRGIANLLKDDINGIFFFDQDSLISKDFITKMIMSDNEISSKQNNVGIITPSIVEQYSTIEFESTNYHRVNETISSGSLIKKDVFLKVGVMEESLFIDYVDFEFCWRVTANNYCIFKSNSVELEHKVGQKIISFFGKKIYVPAPFRYYYVYKNGITLIERNYVPNYWKKRERILQVLTPLIVIFLLDKKIERLSYIWKGITDGYKNK